MKVRRLAFTVVVLIALLLTSPGFGLVFASDGAAPRANVGVTIASGETAEVVVILKPVEVKGVSAAGAVSALKAGAAAAQAAVLDVVAAGGGKVLNTFWINNSVLARVDAATLEALASTPGVERIISNFTVYALDPAPVSAPGVVPSAPPPLDDPPYTWGLEMINAPAAWSDYGLSGAGVSVAVLDTGIDPAHPDFAGRDILFQEFDSAGNPIASAPHDSDIHGTHVSGTIAGGNASGTAIGVAPGVSLLEGLVLPGGSGTLEQVVAGMEWAVAMGADVVNMSLGAGGFFDVFIAPVRNLVAAGIVPAIAIGNDGPGTSGSPGNVLESWGVGAVGPDASVAFYSGGQVVNRSDFSSPPPEWPDFYIKPDLSAPGGDGMGWDYDDDGANDGYGPGNVLSALAGGGYTYLAGTSMATPHVAGAAALLIQYYRMYVDAASGNPVNLVFDALKAGAQDRGDSGLDTRYGWGLINIPAAISFLGGGGGGGVPNIYAVPGWPDPLVIAPDDPNTYGYTFTVGNSGDGDLEYSWWFDWMGGPGGWAWTYYGGGWTPPGEESFFDIFFSPYYAYGTATATALPPGSYYAELVINSNDPDAPELRLPISLQVGWGEAPMISVDPEFIMINVERGSEATEPLTIYNDGSAELEWSVSDRFAKGDARAAASSLPEPLGSAGPREWTANPASDDAGALMRPAGGKMFEGDQLVIGISDYGELDWADPAPYPPERWGMGYGFEYKPARPDGDYGAGVAESLAQGWHGEGYVVYYDGMTVYSYPDGNWGIQPDGRETLVDNPDEAKHRVNVRTDDNRLKISQSFKFDKHGRSVILVTEIKNNSGMFIGDLRYKRVVDWDANSGPGDDIRWMFDPDYYLISTVDPPSGYGGDGQYYAYGTGALGDSWGMVYDWDLNAWDDWWTIDHGWSWVQNGPEAPVDGDYNGALYFALGSLAPGERKVVSLIYTVGQGDSADEAYEDLLSNLGTVGGDVPWLSEDPGEGVVDPGGSQTVDVTVDARGLGLGSYFAQLVLRSNDPGRGRVVIPVQVNVSPPLRWIIDDPEDVDGDPKVDLDRVGVQLTSASVMFVSTLYGSPPLDTPLVSIMMLDTDEDVDTGYTGPMANDIGADFMAFGFVYPNAGVGSAALAAVKKADLSAYARALPGVNVGDIKRAMVKAADDGGPSGELFIFIWDEGSGPGGRGAWRPLMQTFTIGLDRPEEDAPWMMWQLEWLVTMVDDGSMKVVQSAGDIWDIYDTAPDRGHGGTIPASDLMVTGLSALEETAGEVPEFLTGQVVDIFATLANQGDEIERDVWLDFEVYPILAERALDPGEPGYPGSAYTLLDPTPIDSALVEQINPGEGTDVGTTWVFSLVPDPRDEDDPDRSPDGFLHDYLLRVSTEALPRESATTNNEDTLKVIVQVGTEVGLTDIYISDSPPEGAAAADEADPVYTGGTFWVVATLTNNGALDIADYEVTFYVNGEYLDSYWVDGLASLDSTEVWAEWSPAEAGDDVLVEAQGMELDGEINYDDNLVGTEVDVVAGIDVAVNSLTISPSGGSYNWGDALTLTANVSNEGLVALYDIPVVFTVEGEPIEEAGAAALIDSLEPGEEVDVQVEWAANMLGTRLTAEASIEQLEGETETDNNAATSARFNVSGTDVGIDSINITGTPRRGRSINVTVKVENYGTTTPASFNVRLLADGTAVGAAQTVRSLRPGTLKSLTFRWTPASAGSVTLTALVDPPLTGDIDEDNDQLQQGVVVSTVFSDAAVTSVETAGTPIAGKANAVKVTVANQGNERTSFTVELYASGELVKTARVSNLAGGASRTLKLSWKPAAMGDYTLTAKVKDGDVPDDPDADDRVVELATAAYVPLKVKLTATEESTGENRVVRVDIQLLDIRGKSDLAIAGLPVNVSGPVGALLSASLVTTDGNGHAVIYITLTGKTKAANITVTILDLAKGTVRVTL